MVGGRAPEFGQRYSLVQTTRNLKQEDARKGTESAEVHHKLEVTDLQPVQFEDASAADRRPHVGSVAEHGAHDKHTLVVHTQVKTAEQTTRNRAGRTAGGAAAAGAPSFTVTFMLCDHAGP